MFDQATPQLPCIPWQAGGFLYFPGFLDGSLLRAGSCPSTNMFRFTYLDEGGAALSAYACNTEIFGPIIHAFHMYEPEVLAERKPNMRALLDTPYLQREVVMGPQCDKTYDR